MDFDRNSLCNYDAVIFSAGNDVRQFPTDGDDNWYDVVNSIGIPTFFSELKKIGVPLVINISSYYPHVMPELIKSNAYVRSRKNAEDGVTAQFPAAWQEGLQWYYDAMFKDGIAISNPQESAQEIGGNAFSAGRTAMTITNSWYLCCIDPATVPNFDFAPMPANEGTIVSVLDADTFSILKGSQHPKEAFEVLNYFLTEGAPQLYDIYQPLPGLTANQQAFFAAQNEKWGADLNWDVVVESMQYPDIPSTESALPNNLESRQIVSEFNSRIFSTPDLNIEQELANLVTALQASYDKAK